MNKQSFCLNRKFIKKLIKNFFNHENKNGHITLSEFDKDNPLHKLGNINFHIEPENYTL